MGRAWCGFVSLALVALPVSVAVAQETGQEAAQAELPQDAGLPQESAYMHPDDVWKDQRFHAGGFAGKMTGGTPLGSIENVFFRSSYDMSTDSMWGLRVGYAFAPRFDVELEYGRSSPGLNTIVTNLAGQGKTEFPFADLDLDYLIGVVNYAMLERSRRIVPVLSVGYGTVGMSSTASEIADSRQMGLVFGGGLRVRLIDNVRLRADVRGLRTGFGDKQEEDQLPSIFRGNFNATNLYWTAGFEVRF